MRNYFKHVDCIMGHYSTGTMGGELMAKLREEKRCHRRAQTMARDEERDELAPSKHYYPRDRVCLACPEGERQPCREGELQGGACRLQALGGEA